MRTRDVRIVFFPSRRRSSREKAGMLNENDKKIHREKVVDEGRQENGKKKNHGGQGT